MVYFAIEFGFVLLGILRFTIDTTKLNYIESSLLFKITMLEPNSWMHHLFFNENNFWSRPLHIKPLAIELIILYTTSFVNIGLGIAIWILEVIQAEHFVLIVIYWIILSMFLLSTILIEIWLYDKSWSFWREQNSYTQKEIDNLHKEIELIYPNYYEKPKSNK